MQTFTFTPTGNQVCDAWLSAVAARLPTLSQAEQGRWLDDLLSDMRPTKRIDAFAIAHASLTLGHWQDIAAHRIAA